MGNGLDDALDGWAAAVRSVRRFRSCNTFEACLFLTDIEDDTLKLLASENGYAIYKMLLAKGLEK